MKRLALAALSNALIASIAAAQPLSEEKNGAA
jgi:hypothetical protein